jgi:cobalt-zinc-cadmium efflux system membrane fusion protein
VLAGWVLAAWLAAGCGESSAPVSPSAGPAAREGSCEHGVLESVCPKCNPRLAVVFQAKGDWCEEHGFPESFCPICRPEQGGRPMTDVSSDGAPADGTKIRFKTRSVAERAGIETVVAAPSDAQSGVGAVARITWDPTRQAQVNPRSPGVVRRIAVDLGTWVKAGELLAVVQSAEAGADRSRLVAAKTRKEVAERNLARQQGLFADGVVSRKAVDEAAQALAEAEADEGAAAASVGVVGGGALSSPIDGMVVARHSTLGQFVGPEDVLFEIADPTMLWAEIDVPERDLPLVRAGQPVTVLVDGLEQGLPSTLAWVAPSIDPRTRTAMARAPLANADGLLRANQLAEARIDVGEARAAVRVPRAALQTAGQIELMFVQLAVDEYETRRVRTSGSTLDEVVVLAGIKPGEKVVTTGAFLLKTETLKDSIGAGCCDVD